jgi:hypothetical protein
MRRLVALTTAVIAVGCGGGWTDAERDQFMRDCDAPSVASGTGPWDFDPVVYCRCAADELDDRLTVAEARNFPYSTAVSKRTNEMFAAADTTCMDSFSG